MDPSDVAPMVLGVTFFVMTAVVLVLRPIAGKLGTYLEALADEKRRYMTQQPLSRDDAARIANLLETIDQRLAHVEDRQAFTDKLLEGSTRRPDGGA